MILYVGTCPQCGAKAEGRLECPGLIPPPIIPLGCQQHHPTVLVTCQYEGEQFDGQEERDP